jgi:hypothetical protein
MNISVLNEARQHLVRLMQRIRYGRIRNLRVEYGDPVWDQPPEIVRDLMVGKTEEPIRPVSENFALKQKVVELFELFDERQAIEIEQIEVQDGLPFRITIRENVGV